MRTYKIIIVVLLIAFIYVSYITINYAREVQYKIDIGINSIYESDLKNDIILNDDSINILKNIDDITNYFYVSNLLRILKSNGTNDIILK